MSGQVTAHVVDTHALAANPLLAGQTAPDGTPVFVEGVRALGKTPHVAGKAEYNAIDGRTTRHPGYAVSLRIRKRVEEIFGWMKTVGNYRSPKYRGTDRVGWHFTLVAAAYNLVRMRNILAVSPT